MYEAICTCAFALLGIVADALTAGEGDAPASLRASGLVYVICIASPIVKNDAKRVTGRYQRIILAILLAVLAFLGNHAGSASTRVADVFFTLLIGAAGVGLYCTGGVDVKAKEHDSEADLKVKEHITKAGDPCKTLAAALLLYSSLRLFRAGVMLPRDVRNFDAIGEHDVEARGYAAAIESSVVWSITGGAVGVAGAILTLFFDIDTHTKKLVAWIIAAAAFAATLSLTVLLRELDIVFANASCVADVCEAAVQSRRFALTNVPVAHLWLTAIAFAIGAKDKDQRLSFFSRVGVVVLTLFFLLGDVTNAVDLEFGATHVDVALLVGIGVLAFGIAFNSLSAASIAWHVTLVWTVNEEVDRLGSDFFADPIKTAALISSVAAVVYTAFDFLSGLRMLWLQFLHWLQFRRKQKYVPPLKPVQLLQMTLTLVSTSVAAFGFFASLALLAAYDGASLESTLQMRFGNNFVVFGLFPLFFAIPILREERLGFNALVSFAIWTATALAFAVLHMVAMAAQSRDAQYGIINEPVLVHRGTAASHVWTSSAAAVAALSGWAAAGLSLAK